MKSSYGNLLPVSGWLQRLVRCLRWYAGRACHAYLSSVPSNANHIGRNVDNPHDNRPSLLRGVVVDDQDLATGVPATTRADLVLARDTVTETHYVMVGLECYEARAVDAAIFNLPRADKHGVARTAIVALINANSRTNQSDHYDGADDDEPLLADRPSMFMRKHLTRTSSGTAGGPERGLQQMCFHNLTRCIGAASGCLQRWVRPRASRKELLQVRPENNTADHRCSNRGDEDCSRRHVLGMANQGMKIRRSRVSEKLKGGV
jgi:hypothetical protein